MANFVYTVVKQEQIKECIKNTVIHAFLSLVAAETCKIDMAKAETDANVSYFIWKIALDDEITVQNDNPVGG